MKLTTGKITSILNRSQHYFIYCSSFLSPSCSAIIELRPYNNHRLYRGKFAISRNFRSVLETRYVDWRRLQQAAHVVGARGKAGITEVLSIKSTYYN